MRCAFSGNNALLPPVEESAINSYRCEATSIEGFVQQLAVYIAAGYWFYVPGRIPERKSPSAIDRKLIDRFDIGISKWARARRKRLGGANVQYLRFERIFVIVATKGIHVFFRHEPHFKDFRRSPFRFFGYSIGCGQGTDGRLHASVRIHADEYKALKQAFVELACRKSADQLATDFRRLPYAPFARIRRQYLCLLRAVNRKRQTAGLGPVPLAALRLRRQVVRPFE